MPRQVLHVCLATFPPLTYPQASVQAVSVHSFRWSQVATLLTGHAEVQCQTAFLRHKDHVPLLLY